jgi:hypothetical protein
MAARTPFSPRYNPGMLKQKPENGVASALEVGGCVEDAILKMLVSEGELVPQLEA